MFWDKEKIVSVWEEPEAIEGDPYIRKPCHSDRDVKTIRLDRETGDYITLFEEKMRYPYKTRVSSNLHVQTNLRHYEIKLNLDYDSSTQDYSFIWNGQNIPAILWSLLGISKHSPEGLTASKWHDYLLFKKDKVLKHLKAQGNALEFKKYRRLTTLIFREWLKKHGVNTIKANIMAGAVGAWQFVSPQWWGMGEE